MLYYYLILLTNNHSTLNYIVILINLLTYLGTIGGTVKLWSNAKLDANKSINCNSVISSIYLNSPKTYQIQLEQRIYKINTTKSIYVKATGDESSGQCGSVSVSEYYISIRSSQYTMTENKEINTEVEFNKADTLDINIPYGTGACMTSGQQGSITIYLIK